MSEWRFKKDAEPQGSSDGFWYDLTAGGYIKPEEVLEDADQIKKVDDAVQILMDFEAALEANELLNEF